MLDFLNLGVIPPKFNETHIILIPKVKSPQKITKYRPINLSNVVSRIASKVLASRLKVVLPTIISKNHSAFMTNRLILDNILVAFEVMNHTSWKRGGLVGEMALKLDISKMYDIVEWGGLEQIMIRMGFHSRWIKIIMQCLSFVTHSIRINGVPQGHITPTRSLCQGDPLFPYLFLLCAKGLSSLIRKATIEDMIHGISICRQGPQLSHLFFADDSLLFYQATSAECEKLMRVLQVYELSTSQQLNWKNTSLFFSSNTPPHTQEHIKQLFEAEVIKQHEIYLGLPSLVGRSKRNTFQQLKERLANKFSEWKEKLLSNVDKGVLIQAVAQAILAHTMSCFLLPKICVMR